MATTFILTLAMLGQAETDAVSEIDAQLAATSVEQYFDLMERPEFFRTQTIVTNDDPPEMPELTEELRLERHWQTGMKCGPVALYFLLRLNGIDHVSMQQILDEVPTNERGTNLKALQDAALRYGMEAAVVRVTPETVSRLPHGSIVHWNTNEESGQSDDHFDVYLSFIPDSGRYQIIDTTSCITKLVPHDSLAQMASGYALMPQRTIRSKWTTASLWVVFVMMLVMNAFVGIKRFRP